MSRRALAVLLVALTGCQSYNFNPVGKCVIQPGTTQLKLDAVNAADILFVVDDSNSMASNQANLARNFRAFIDELATTQQERVARGLQPFEFHVAVTTSSVYENLAAQGGAQCTGSGTQRCDYRTFVDNSLQGYVCEDPFTASQTCGDLIQQYWDFAGATHGGCAPGPGVQQGQRYPQGDFVGPANGKVLHFTKDLDWKGWNAASPTGAIADLIAKFAQNITVGTCGSGQEQHLEAGRLAVRKALRQEGLAQPADVKADEFPHANAKLVVVFVGDEDDCSSGFKGVASGQPQFDRTNAVQANNELDTRDSCVIDYRARLSGGRTRQTPPADYASFFLGLGRPFAAAFISSGTTANGRFQPGVCQTGTPPAACTAGDVSLCQGKSSGTRMHDLATALAAGGAAVVEGSICDPEFSTTLRSIAQLVKPPSGLQLPSQPASGDVTVLRIVRGDGSTARVCRGPGPTTDFWFVRCGDATGTPLLTPTSCLGIKAGSSCEANPGESYSAEYLGVVPGPSTGNPLGGCAAATLKSSECAGLLGGRAEDWTCEIPNGLSRGTCLCNGTSP